jgi:hypothetical protein
MTVFDEEFTADAALAEDFARDAVIRADGDEVRLTNLFTLAVLNLASATGKLPSEVARKVGEYLEDFYG